MIAPRLIDPPQHRRGRKRPRVILALTLLGLGCVGLTAFGRPAPRLVWNVSASAPRGLYRTLPGVPVRRGDLVLVRMPASVRDLAAARGYLPSTVPLVKRVAALGGDVVCILDNEVIVGGKTVATRLEHDRSGRPLPRWSDCRTLDIDEVFLLMAAVPDSFDSRYFGPVSLSAVIGRLVPLWTE
jgi:conjugative transfer signal peptidase TraF